MAKALYRTSLVFVVGLILCFNFPCNAEEDIVLDERFTLSLGSVSLAPNSTASQMELVFKANSSNGGNWGKGWVGIGFKEDDSDLTDFIMIDHNLLLCADMYTLEDHSENGSISRDRIQDCHAWGAGSTTAFMRRLLNTCDSAQDVVIQDKEITLLWAYSDEDGFGKGHVQSGTKRMNLLRTYTDYNNGDEHCIVATSTTTSSINTETSTQTEPSSTGSENGRSSTTPKDDNGGGDGSSGASNEVIGAVGLKATLLLLLSILHSFFFIHNITK